MNARTGATALTAAGALLLAGCGGGGGGGGGTSPPPAPSSYTVGVTVSGLAGTGLVLRNNGGDNLTVTANGAATFATSLSGGAAYAVTVATQPTSLSQVCTVANGTGTVASANITNITVTCVMARFPISVSVSGLAGSGLTLMQRSEEMEVSSNGTISFPTGVESGQAYEVRVARQPVSPNQRCFVSGPSAAGGILNAGATAAVQCITHVPRFAYSVDFDNKSISMYAVDAASGQLRPRGYVRTGLNPVQLFSNLSQRFWFALNRGDSSLSVFQQDPVTSALSEMPGSPIQTGGTGGPETIAPTHMAVHPKWALVYVVNGAGTDNVAAFAYDQISGTVTPVPGSPFDVGPDPSWLKFDASGQFAYVSHRGSNDVRIYSVSPNGVLTEISANSRVSIGSTPGLLTFTSNGRFAYVTSSNGVSAFGVNAATGVLTPLTGSPYPTGVNPSFLTPVHPSDKFLYVHAIGAQDTNGTITPFRIDQSTGVLTQIGAQSSVGPNSTAAIIDGSGRFMLVANRGAPLTVVTGGSVSAFRIDQTTGELTALAGIPNVPAFNVEFDPSSHYVYVTRRDNSVAAYTLDATSGTLTPLSHGAIVATRKTPLSLTVDTSVRTPTAATFRSKFAYVTNRSAGSISSYSIDGSTGAFTETAGSPLAATASPRFAALHPSGRHLLVGDTDDATGLSSYPINATTGALSSASGSLATPAGTTKVLFSPHGWNAYAINEPLSMVEAFGLGTDGSISRLQSDSFLNTGPAARDITIAPNGRFLNFITSDVQGRSELDTTTGGLTNPISTAVSAGQLAQAINPRGTHLYIARSGAMTGSVETWEIHLNGQIAQVGSAKPAGTLPSAMTIDPTGRFLYVANSGSSNVSQYAVNQIDGTLTELVPAVSTGVSTTPTSIAADYNGKFIYVLIPQNNQVLTFSIDATGRLQPSGSAPAATGAGAAHLVVTTDVE